MQFIWLKINLFFKTYKKLKLFYKIILVSFVIFAVYIGNVVFFPQSIPNGQYQVIINKNQNLNELATFLYQQKIIKSKRMLLLLLRGLNKDKQVTAGLYLIKHPISIWGLIHRITNGKPDQISVTLLDGWTIEQLRDYIKTVEQIKHITDDMTESDLRLALKVEAPNLEGLFYPSTYFIAPGQTDLEIYQHAYKMMQDKLVNLYNKRSKFTTYNSPYQLLIMASLIEKETSDVSDRHLVSTVFNNRIRAQMKLQDDPSVFYGLSKQKNKKSKLSKFQIDTPYNTYLHWGLPPTPICIPSEASLIAASQPEDRPKLYFFVAIGSGKTKFSATYNEHLSAVNRYVKKPTKPRIQSSNSQEESDE